VAVPVIKSSFIAGEIAPGLWGHVDFAKFSLGTSTMRNFFVHFQGGAYSRAGFAFAGFSKQTGRNFPPRVIPFQFSISQGLVLEFGNFYMRVVKNGAFVTENPFQITGLSNTNPAVVTYTSLSTATSAAANNGAVSASYQRGDLITLAGGVFSTAAVFQVTTLTLAILKLLSGGTGYAVNDRITLTSGGTANQNPVLTVTGVSGGVITTFVISNGGVFTANNAGNFSQLSTTGSGTGATFNGGLFGPLGLNVTTPGAYTTIPTNPANQSSTSGLGAGATFTVVWATPSALSAADWVFLAGIGGPTALNNQSYVIGSVTATTFTISDPYGNFIDATALPAYVSGGTASRIYTLQTPYSEQDLEYLKFTQSADVMTICCVNQVTSTEYQQQDLTRLADNNWTFSTTIAVPTVTAPPAASAAASSAGGVDYQYVVTAVSPVDGSESQASPIAEVDSAVNIASTAGTITVTWTGVAGVNQYNVYKALPGIGSPPPAGSLFGFAGSAYGTQFIDPNIVADFTQVPPLHKNPFAPGQITAVNVTNSTGTVSSVTFTITTNTGSGLVLQPVIVGSALVAIIVQNEGQNYKPTDTVAVNVTGGGSATAALVVGPQSGNYPSVVAYFQQRRAYANTLNQPDTYFMSQPGAFNNFDFRIPTLDSDAIIGTPWSVEINGIQWLLPMPGGLVAFTGLSVWQINGAGSSSFNPTPITPSSQSAVPQSSIGSSITVPPIKIESDIIYVQAKNSDYLDATYQIYTNNYTVDYITLNSWHLFYGFQTREHAWCEQPFKTLWSVRGDGILLSLAYMKAQQIQGWARHDTNGLFWSVCSVTEPPVDALYVATERFPPTYSNGLRTFFIERQDDRIWDTVENCWCVDCGFSLAQPTPSATLTASSATGAGQVTGFTNLIGGKGYSAATTASVVDDNGKGPGTGAVPTLTIVGGVITNITFPPNQNYINPQLVISDPAGSAGGSGATATLTLNNNATFSASAPVFSAGNVGQVLRMGGGIATIVAFIDSQHVTANISVPITQVIQNGSNTPQVATAGNWTMTTPITTVSGLRPLAGLPLVGLADGVPVGPLTVNAQGSVTLPNQASSITLGLAFKPQLQSVYLDAGEPTVQGQRKKIGEVTARIEASGSFMMGSNQPDGSIQSPIQVALTWNVTNVDLTVQPSKAAAKKAYNATATPLWTGDIRIPVSGGFNTHGQVCVEQDLPLPLQILAFVPEVYPGDNSSTAAPKQQQQARK
jgi:hypothetical protein